MSLTVPPPPSVAIRRVLDFREVRVVYQPVVDLRTRKTFAYESLVRSKAPEFDSPMALFAAAVEHSCTGELGRLLRELSLEGCPDFPLFLNIHPAELNEKWIVQTNDPLYQHDRDVYLEITEGVPLSHFHLCQTILQEIRGRGVFLVVDDLGAGYSNLKYIADLQPRVVKLDRGLIAGLTTDSRLFKLVSAIVVMCRELDALVVAEGIETIPELEAVVASGARFGQGYLLARPNFPLPEVTWPESVASSRFEWPRTETPRADSAPPIARAVTARPVPRPTPKTELVRPPPTPPRPEPPPRPSEPRIESPRAIATRAESARPIPRAQTVRPLASPPPRTRTQKPTLPHSRTKSRRTP